MSSISDYTDQQQNEENTKLNRITPVLQSRWKNISMEYVFTDGRVSVDEYNVAHRGKTKKADYLLLYDDYVPLAVVEAKGADRSADNGYNQAIEYARILDVPFAYATNGDDLIEKDMISGLNRQMKMKDFPGPDELWERTKRERGFTDSITSIYTYPYYITPDGKRPRYYQRIAINRTVEAISRGQKKILLVLATGTGKTYLSFQIIYRFWKTQTKKKILYLADRNVLVDQTMRNDFAPFEDAMVKVNGRSIDTAHEIYLSLYQQLKDVDVDNYRKLPRDFFDMIVVDECHRGSADLNSNWHEILSWFHTATQIGLTATPKDDADPNRNNFAYFGEPIYTYSLKQGIEDGFLAPYKVISVQLDIDKYGYRPEKGTLDDSGVPIKIKTYTQEDFDNSIVVAERREAVAKKISHFMEANDIRYAKTIVFCHDIPHCQEMVRLLENENADLVAEDPRYVMQITGDNDVGKAQLDNFINPASKYPVIAVTSRLMSTGVDAQTCEIIVLDRKVGSMTEFKQIIGRGTRIKEEYEVDGESKTKMFFTILDFRSNYLKFEDPDFDGDPTSVTDWGEGKPAPKPPIKPTSKPDYEPVVPPENRRVARISGIDVEIIGETVRYLDADGHLVEQNLSAFVRNYISSRYGTYEDSKAAWLLVKDKTSFANDLLLDIDWSENYRIRYGYTVDNFDIIANFGYDIEPPMSKNQRTYCAAVARYLERFNDNQRQLLRLLLDAYAATNFANLKDLEIFNMHQFTDLGWTKLKAVKAFGGKEKYYGILTELENKIYE